MTELRDIVERFAALAAAELDERDTAALTADDDPGAEEPPALPARGAVIAAVKAPPTLSVVADVSPGA